MMRVSLVFLGGAAGLTQSSKAETMMQQFMQGFKDLPKHFEEMGKNIEKLVQQMEDEDVAKALEDKMPDLEKAMPKLMEKFFNPKMVDGEEVKDGEPEPTEEDVKKAVDEMMESLPKELKETVQSLQKDMENIQKDVKEAKEEGKLPKMEDFIKDMDITKLPGEAFGSKEQKEKFDGAMKKFETLFADMQGKAERLEKECKEKKSECKSGESDEDCKNAQDKQVADCMIENVTKELSDNGMFSDLTKELLAPFQESASAQEKETQAVTGSDQTKPIELDSKNNMMQQAPVTPEIQATPSKATAASAA